VTVLTVRNLDDETRAGLKELGVEHGRSMEAEARAILADAVRTQRKPPVATGLGTRIHELFAGLDWEGVERPAQQARAASLEQS
jgi:antitoxin FitA